MNDPYRSECRAVSELLAALAAGELEPERAAQLHAHLGDCQACQAELAVTQQTHALATGLKLDSPALDRYAEFLRRLAADDAARAQQALARLTEPATAMQASETVSLKTERPDGGVAAVVPLFGRRVMLRSGFGKGFELTVVSPQGRELFRLAATSLTRVAAVAAGVSLFAGLSAISILLLFTSVWKGQPKEVQQAKPQSPFEHAERRPGGPPARDWVRTFSDKSDTLALWPEGGQLRVNWLVAGAQAPPVQLALPHFEGERMPPPPELMVTAASDGHGAVVAREERSALFIWHVSGKAQRHAGEPIQPAMSLRGSVQPALAWFGDRYLLAYIQPSETAPRLELLPLGRGGEPLQERGLLAATTEQADKVGMPCLVGTGAQGALFFLTETGKLEGRTLTLDQGRVELGERALITTLQHRERTPIQAKRLADGYLLCWGEMEAGQFELRLARVDTQLKTESVVTLVSSAAPVPAFDWRLDAAGLLFTWLEEQPERTQIFTQQFSLEGEALATRQVVLGPLKGRNGLAFADDAGHNLVLTQRSIDQPLHLEIRPLR